MIFPTTYDFRFESEVWRAFFGKRYAREFSKRKRRLQIKAQSDHDYLFHPEMGVHLILSEQLRYWAEQIEGGLHKWNNEDKFGCLPQFHPDAMRFLAEYGTLQEPYIFKERPHTEPTPGDCCGNSYLYMHCAARNEIHLDYSEGLAAGATIRPMLHAWNTLPEKNLAFDSTFYTSSRWAKYFGITLNLKEHAEANRCIHDDDSYSLLFTKRRWNGKLESYLKELLGHRRSGLAAARTGQ